MRLFPLVAGLLLLGTACSDALTPYAPSDSDSGDVQRGPVGISDLDPHWGPTDGGTEVTIEGWGFEGDVVVTFGAASLDVTVIDDETLVVTSPSSRREASIDVTVFSDLGSVTESEGFTYSDSGAPPETDTEDETDSDATVDEEVDATGLSGGVLEIGLVQYACPDCQGLTEDIEVWATAMFHEPATGSYVDWIPTTGTCQSNPTRSFPSTATYDVGSWVYLESGSNSLSLGKTTSEGDTLYESSGLDNSDFSRSTGFDLSIPDGGDLGSAVDIEDALFTPSGFTSITPTEMLYTSPNSAFAAQFSRSSATAVTWAPTGSGLLMIDLIVYNAAGTALIGEVLCATDDDGSASVPSGYLSSYPAGSLLLIYIYRLELGETVMPVDGSTLDSLASIGVVGTGVVR